MSRPVAVLLAFFSIAMADPSQAGIILPPPPGPLTIDFEEFSDGEVVAGPVGSHSGYTLVVDRFTRGADEAIAYDTEFASRRLAAFGNESQFGNVLTLSPSHRTAASGSLTFLLDDFANSLSFDWIGFGGPTDGSVRLLQAGKGEFFSIAEFTLSDLGIPSGAPYGSAFHVDLGLVGFFDAFEIVLDGASGVDNFSIGGGIQEVPEPASAALLGFGLAAFATAARRRAR